MKVGIVGAGRIGHAVAVRLAAAGHEVMLAIPTHAIFELPRVQ